jgi:hypothetical protein
MVPIPNSNIPFMPKVTKSDEVHKLYIFSKDKYMIESIIKNSGAPYT